MLSLETLAPLVARVRSLVQQWQEADTFTARAALHDPLTEAVDELARLIDADNVHPDAWASVLAADELVTQSRHWLDAVAELDPAVSQAAHAAAEAAAKAIEPEDLPTVEQLRDSGHSFAQIATTWRWFAIGEDGLAIPDSARVIAAIANPQAPRSPGPHPATVRQHSELESRWEARRRARRGAQPRKCKESVEQLLEQGVGIKQIQKMTGKTPGEIEAVARELGRVADPDQREKPSRFAPSPEVLLSRINSHPEHGQDMKARIRAMRDDGRSPGIIVQAMRKNGFPQVSLQLVEQILADEPTPAPA